MRRVLVLLAVVVLALTAGRFVRVAFGSTRPKPLRVTPGEVFIKANGGLNVFIYNPTGSTITVRGHLDDPVNVVGFFDNSATVGPHATGAIGWSCGVSACHGVPIVTAPRRTALNANYVDQNSVEVNIFPGQFKAI